MFFLFLMILGVLALAGNVIFFSVWGLAQTFTFTAFFWGAAIEGSKLIIASFLYRARERLSKVSKAVGWTIVIGMMVITSFGIYGHILSGYQQNDAEIRAQEIRLQDAITSLERFDERLSDLNIEIESIRGEITIMNRNITEISTREDGFITARARAADEIRQDRVRLQERLDTLLSQREQVFEEREPVRERVIATEAEMLDVELKVGPIVTIIELLGGTGERAILWFILLIVFVFDPAAVYLTVQANKYAIWLKEEKEKKEKEESGRNAHEPEPIKEIDIKQTEESIIQKIREELPKNDSSNEEILSIVKKLSEDTVKTTVAMQDIKNKIDQSDKKSELKKNLLKD